MSDKRNTEPEPRTRMVRVNLTDGEWTALRMKAVERGEPVQQLVTTLLRQAVNRWR